MHCNVDLNYKILLELMQMNNYLEEKVHWPLMQFGPATVGCPNTNHEWYSSIKLCFHIPNIFSQYLSFKSPSTEILCYEIWCIEGCIEMFEVRIWMRFHSKRINSMHFLLLMKYIKVSWHLLQLRSKTFFWAFRSTSIK